MQKSVKVINNAVTIVIRQLVIILTSRDLLKCDIMIGNMKSPLAQLNTPKADNMSVPLLVCKYTVPIATKK